MTNKNDNRSDAVQVLFPVCLLMSQHVISVGIGLYIRPVGQQEVCTVRGRFHITLTIGTNLRSEIVTTALGKYVIYN